MGWSYLLPGGHHHPPLDGVERVGADAGGDGDGPAQQEGDGHAGVLAEQQGLEGVVEAEVHAAVDEDAHGGDGEASVQALDAVRLEGLHVDIDQTIELALTTLTLGIVGQPTKLG